MNSGGASTNEQSVLTQVFEQELPVTPMKKKRGLGNMCLASWRTFKLSTAQCCHKSVEAKERFTEQVAGFFEQFAFLVFCYPWKFIIIPTLLCCLFSLGFINRVPELNMERLYGLPVSRTTVAQDQLIRAFPIERISYVFAVATDRTPSLLTATMLDHLTQFWDKVTHLRVPISLLEKAVISGDESVAQYLLTRARDQIEFEDDYVGHPVGGRLSPQRAAREFPIGGPGYIRLGDVCVRTAFGTCQVLNPLDLYATPSQWGTPLRSAHYPDYVNFRSGIGFRLDTMLGGMQTTDFTSSTVVANATALAFRLTLLGGSGNLTEKSAAWEQGLVALVQHFHMPGVELYVRTERSINDELSNSSQLSGTDLLLLLLASVFVSTFTVVMNSSVDWYRTKTLPALVGIATTALAYGGGVGIWHLLGMRHVPPAEATPFMILGICVDDIFVIINAYSLTYMYSDDARKRIGLSLRDSGISITITTLTNVVAFGVGATSVYYSIYVFCIVTASGLFAGYLLCLTVFLGALSLAAQWEERHIGQSVICTASDNASNTSFRFSELSQRAQAADSTNDGDAATTGGAGLLAPDPTQTRRSRPTSPTGLPPLLLAVCPAPAASSSMTESTSPNSPVLPPRAQSQPASGTSSVARASSGNQPPPHAGDRTIMTAEAVELFQDHGPRSVSAALTPSLLSLLRSDGDIVPPAAPPASPARNAFGATNIRLRSDDSHEEANLEDHGVIRNRESPPEPRGDNNSEESFEPLLNCDRGIPDGFYIVDELDNHIVVAEWVAERDRLKQERKRRRQQQSGGRPSLLKRAFWCGRRRSSWVDTSSSVRSSSDNTKQLGGGTTTAAGYTTAASRLLEEAASAATNTTAFPIDDLPRLVRARNVLMLLEKIPKEPKGTVGRGSRFLFMNYYGPFLLHPVMKAVVLLGFLALFMAAVIFSARLETGLQLRDVTPYASYLRDFYQVREDYFTAYGDECILFFPEGGQWWDLKVQRAVRHLNDRMTASPHIAYVLDAFEEFMKDFRQMPDAVPPETGAETGGGNQKEDDRKQVFMRAFTDWLTHSPRGQLLSTMFTIENGTLTSWKVHYWMQFIDNTRTSIGWIEEVRAMAQEAKQEGAPEAHVFSPLAVHWESDLVIFKATLTNMIVALVAMGVVAGILLRDFFSGLLVLIIIVVIDIAVIGTMPLMYLKLNMLTMVNLVLSIGFAVDYTAHITHCFSHCKGKTRDRRALESLVLMGLPITEGMVTTYLAVGVLAASHKYVMIVVFRMMTAVLVYASIHGVVLMPVVLSLIGPLSYDDAEVVKIQDGWIIAAWTVDGKTGVVRHKGGRLTAGTVLSNPASRPATARDAMT